MEVFKQIKNSIYAISNQGNIKNVKTNIILKGCTSKKYNYNKIKIDGKFKTLYIHRLVAEYFVENPNNYPDVHHIDNNSKNNNSNNLRYETRSNNCRLTNRKKKSNYPRGVSYNNAVCKFQAQISFECKAKHLGYFKTVEEARAKYLSAYKEIMGYDCIY